MTPPLPPEPTEDRIIDAIQPIRAHALAVGIHHLFDTGLYASLEKADGATAAQLATAHGFDATRLAAFLKYLRNEGILRQDADLFRLTAKGRELHAFRGWYTMFIGGYAGTFMQLGEALKTGAAPATRDGRKVGIGANEISTTDTIPLASAMARRHLGTVRHVLDLGCGSGQYLVELCKAFPEARGWGVEPSRGGCDAAADNLRRHGLQDRVQLTCAPAQEFVKTPVSSFPADFGVVAFVLQEILGQGGDAAVEQFLRDTFERFPDLHLLALEVDYRLDDPALMHHGLGLAFYNPYYLLHPFTAQRLEPLAFWESLFTRCGLELVVKEPIDRRVDSTGLVVGFLLRRAR
ncbi:methyltransferase domain-containing protein [Corallococcus exercitus]|uniref:Methyltransferase domain-containing protein n=1 Tax=Corallococcus exercitus TaxID=2316736 RepID=A0A3A8HYL0_9BACT|nr:methyltransferase domain-containing protein [Corallococcus exercitus]NOK38483.1 methyltransferase domain-containing protein [Corallococcus exercitus]RKG71011.1 methyltransferase domain-containing protein [Corallococcus exercitus]